MTTLICSYCLCLALALQNGGNCHSCKTGTKQELVAATLKLSDPEEFMASNCYPPGSKPAIDMLGFQGSIVSKGGKKKE